MHVYLCMHTCAPSIFCTLLPIYTRIFSSILKRSFTTAVAITEDDDDDDGGGADSFSTTPMRILEGLNVLGFGC